MNAITGRTAIFAIIADPIAHVKTPQALNALMRSRGVDGVLIPIHVKADDLAIVVAGLRKMQNLKGVVVTVPHKTAMLALCDAASDEARAIGAVNAVRREPDGRLTGEMLDGAGFVAGLRRAGVDPRGQSVYLAGAGGAGAAIAFALMQAGAEKLTLANRTRAKSEDLARRLKSHFPYARVAVDGVDPAGHTLVVNATSLGLRPDDPLPLDAMRLSPNQIVAEIIMDPAPTALLLAAEARGCRTHPGRPMLDAQLELMADFMGAEP